VSGADLFSDVDEADIVATDEEALETVANGGSIDLYVCSYEATCVMDDAILMV
jgi:hypothetical protein